MAIVLVVMVYMFLPYTGYLNSTLNHIIYSINMLLFIFLNV